MPYLINRSATSNKMSETNYTETLNTIRPFTLILLGQLQKVNNIQNGSDVFYNELS